MKAVARAAARLAELCAAGSSAMAQGRLWVLAAGSRQAAPARRGWAGEEQSYSPPSPPPPPPPVGWNELYRVLCGRELLACAEMISDLAQASKLEGSRGVRVALMWLWVSLCITGGHGGSLPTQAVL